MSLPQFERRRRKMRSGQRSQYRLRERVGPNEPCRTHPPTQVVLTSDLWL
jgi:hypothetical protein